MVSKIDMVPALMMFIDPGGGRKENEETHTNKCTQQKKTIRKIVTEGVLTSF